VWELYNINDDRVELNDLIGGDKERANAMIQFYNEWAERCEVEDWATAPFNPRPNLKTITRHNHGNPRGGVTPARLGPRRELAKKGRSTRNY